MTIKRIILASRSPTRQFLLNCVGLQPISIPSNYSEKNEVMEKPHGLVRKLSYEKAKIISYTNADAVVIAADTIGVIDGRFIGKPYSLTDAKNMLGQLSDRTHSVITGFSIIIGNKNVTITKSVESKVSVKKLTESEIDNYVSTLEPMGKAGAYAIQGKGAFIVKSVEGDRFNVMGLPLRELLASLRDTEIGDVVPASETIDELEKRIFSR